MRFPESSRRSRRIALGVLAVVVFGMIAWSQWNRTPTTPDASLATKPPPANVVASAAVQANDDEMRRYDDPTFSPDERQAVRAATATILGPQKNPPDVNVAFRYMVSKQGDGWMVMVWDVYGFDKGKPQFTPGGYTGLLVDRNFKVAGVIPGE
jgi:hypothetical protein